MTPSAVLFDLDGTLTDPGLGITNSVAYALSHYGIVVPDRTVLYPFIGPPLTESFARYYRFNEEEAKKAVEIYREYFSVKGLFENEVYEGIEPLLSTLAGNGIKVILATSKPEIYARQILSHFSLDHYFTYIAGAELNHRRIDKHEVIEYALSHAQITDRSSVIMVGDRHYDILGAKQSSLFSLGVTYGYGTEDELRDAGADVIVHTVSELFFYLTE